MLLKANGAISTADFSAKISIGYKECLQTKYWLTLLNEANYLPAAKQDHLIKAADEPAKILYSILKTTRLQV